MYRESKKDYHKCNTIVGRLMSAIEGKHRGHLNTCLTDVYFFPETFNNSQYFKKRQCQCIVSALCTMLILSEHCKMNYI